MQNKIRLGIKFLIIVLMITFMIFILNIKVTTHQGINYIVQIKKIPLYLKILDFFDRHFQYKELVREITYGCQTDEDKVKMIFDWTHKNIKKPPKGFPIIDDHVLNIIIRGWGVHDQSADVFTTLCSYGGIEAKRYPISPKGSKDRLQVSVAKLNGKWLLFDTYHGIYFKNKQGLIASVDDIKNNQSLILQLNNRPIFKGYSYEEFFNNLQPVEKMATSRGKSQMPLPRLLNLFKKLIKK